MEPRPVPLVPVGDVGAIAHAAIDILESGADARARLGQAGREAAVLRFGRDAWLARLTRFYAEVLDSGPSVAAVPVSSPRKDQI